MNARAQTLAQRLALEGLVADLTDEELGRKGHLERVGGEVSAGQLLDYVVLRSGASHLANMRAATGR